MKRPSFQFYPADWQANSNLRRCSHEEKGIWIDIICLLHDQNSYGIIRWSLKEIAQAIGTTPRKIRNLIDKGILKGCDTGEICEPLTFAPKHGRATGPEVTLIERQDGPLWYSSRMVVDEYKRQVRAGEIDPPKDSPKGGIGAAPKGAPMDSPDPSPSRARAPSTSTSTSSNKYKPPPPTREAVLSRLISKGVPEADLISAKFFNHFDAVGWMTNGQPIVNWKSKLDNWVLEESQRATRIKPAAKESQSERIAREEREYRESLGIGAGPS